MTTSRARPARTALALACLALLAARAEGLELEGLIEPREIVEVSSQVPGILAEVQVERGDRVTKGQVLARLRDDVEQIALELAEAQVQFSQRKAERNEELYASQMVSVHDRDELETEILMNQLQVKEAAAHLAMRTIRSPIDGVVTKRYRAAGEYVGSDPVVKVARLHPLNVEVIAPVEQFGSLRAGMQAIVQPEAPVGGSFRGRVVLVDQVIDAASGTFGVRVEVPNEDYALPAGLNCRVSFPDAR